MPSVQIAFTNQRNPSNKTTVNRVANLRNASDKLPPAFVHLKVATQLSRFLLKRTTNN